jgi:preprotein translocase subunit SecA
VEENNFGIRKRLLEYDDVMNSQRTVIYTKRAHALHGDRLSVDIVNMLYDVCDSIVTEYQDAGDYEGFRLELIRLLAMDCPIDQNTFLQGKADDITHQLFELAQNHYKHKTQVMAEKAFPVIKDVFENNGQTIENIIVPFTDGLKEMQVMSNLKKTYQSHGKEIITVFEQSVSLTTIDEDWKEHLREMDELKQSVQNAVYEQKDPLLVYKFESFQLFKQMLNRVNKDIISFLFKGIIPDQSPQQVQAARPMKQAPQPRLKVGRDDDFVSSSTHPEIAEAAPKVQPLRAEVKIGRNDPCPCGSGKKFKNCHGVNEA